MDSKVNNATIKDELIHDQTKVAKEFKFTQASESLDQEGKNNQIDYQTRFLSITMNPKHGYLNLLAIPITFFVHQALQADMTSLTYYMLEDNFGVSDNDIG